MELTAARVGNPTKRYLLLDSRDEPWSAAERKFHRLLHDAGITGWKANRPVVLDDFTCYVDVIFRGSNSSSRSTVGCFTPVQTSSRMGRTSRITASVRERAKDAAMIEVQPQMVLAMVREAIEMLTAARATRSERPRACAHASPGGNGGSQLL
jgi:hypothetical protein